MIGVLVALAACGGGDGEPAAADAGPIDVSDLAYAPCDLETRVGTFRVDLEPEFTGVGGSVLDGVVLQDVPTLEAEDGECRRLAPRALFCAPGCEPGQTCGAEGCVPYPAALDVGTVSVAGMVVSFDMSPLPPGNFYTNPGTLPHPGYEPGAGIELRADGGEVEPFVLQGWGASAIVATIDEVAVEAGSPVSLGWEAPADPGPARVRVTLEVNRHGASAQRIECDVDDDGAAEIPVALVDALVGAGLSGFPQVSLWRRSADHVAIEPGCVELFVGARVELPVVIPGLDSCSEDADCPDGETCQPDLTCA